VRRWLLCYLAAAGLLLVAAASPSAATAGSVERGIPRNAGEDRAESEACGHSRRSRA